MSEETKTEKKSEDSEVITIKKESLWKYSTFILGAALVLTVYFGFFNEGTQPSPTGRVVDTGNQPNPTPPSEPSQVRASIDDDAVLGDENAPVTIIEFSDYQCPFCERFWSQTLPQIKSQYIDTGKVKLVYRDFPLESIHPMAAPAALAAECVGEQGDEAYFKMHDKIFGNQQALSPDNLKQWAKDLGYDIDNCFDSGQFRSEVQKDLQDATSSGGRGTPYFVIMGKDGQGTPISGAQPFGAFQQAIDAASA